MLHAHIKKIERYKRKKGAISCRWKIRKPGACKIMELSSAGEDNQPNFCITKD